MPAGSVSSFSTLQTDLPKCKPLVRVALPASLSARSFPFTPARPGQYTLRSFRRWMSTIDTFQSGIPIPLFNESIIITNPLRSYIHAVTFTASSRLEYNENAPSLCDVRHLTLYTRCTVTVTEDGHTQKDPNQL